MAHYRLGTTTADESQETTRAHKVAFSVKSRDVFPTIHDSLTFLEISYTGACHAPPHHDRGLVLQCRVDASWLPLLIRPSSQRFPEWLHISNFDSSENNTLCHWASVQSPTTILCFCLPSIILLLYNISLIYNDIHVYTCIIIIILLLYYKFFSQKFNSQ